MPKTNHFTRDQVLDAAFGLVRERGVKALTARAVARRLGTSTSPIFSNFRSMSEMMPGIAEKAHRLLFEYQTRERPGGDRSMDMAMGYVEFARREPHLFWDVLAMGWRDGEPHGGPTDEEAIARMRRNPRMADLSDEALKDVRRKLRIFIHGIASLSKSDAASLGDERIETLIKEVGVAVVRYAKKTD